MSKLTIFSIFTAVTVGLFPVVLQAAPEKGAKAAQQKAKGSPKKRKPNPAMAPVEDVDGLPRVLLIGDSISIGYTVPVREAMKGEANVHRPRANCGPTTSGLSNIEAWLATGGEGKEWDVIHFNWGLHDLKYLGPKGENLQDPNDPKNHQQVPPDEYRANLQKLVDRLQETGAKLIWRNTTPVPEGARGRVVGHSVAYNKIAAEIMDAEKIPTHDLYSFALERQDTIQKKADVHFTPDGSKALGEDVARVIREALAE
ncbi:MAG: SGNH/GDSL hydrolase family protein [Verrucomicrobiales bacterium]|nr:SGNH/GDSL hydrolase family protein [Verrucomicrobiales bacterium]